MPWNKETVWVSPLQMDSPLCDTYRLRSLLRSLGRAVTKNGCNVHDCVKLRRGFSQLSFMYYYYFFHHTTCESTCDTLASSAANQGDNTVSVAQGCNVHDCVKLRKGFSQLSFMYVLFSINIFFITHFRVVLSFQPSLDHNRNQIKPLYSIITVLLQGWFCH